LSEQEKKLRCLLGKDVRRKKEESRSFHYLEPLRERTQKGEGGMGGGENRLEKR